ncbi:MAG: GIY-YIG nuclease family protein [Hydrogenophaga sp.]|uniref:GIY-YIG nuclease family protein n=1 Tax=Hydrogenophaga sp. TaxID=1904254 RepID=UPI0026039D51|nr:GIY-YIG nuclease family protein [Hydrogenophaga sp.]MCV0437288.1 GIY-YIG nuclease family protein [Hydrogenophaga sp.]
MAKLTRACGRFLTTAELRIARRTNDTVPSHGLFDRMGSKGARIARLRAGCLMHSKWKDVADLLPDQVDSSEAAPQTAAEGSSGTDGYVYMLRPGTHYKLGRTFAVPRRHRQISLDLPEKPDVVHAIATDDSEGIEACGYRRCAAKQTNGEWFTLDAQDVRAFRRRKFM